MSENESFSSSSDNTNNSILNDNIEYEEIVSSEESNNEHENKNNSNEETDVDMDINIDIDSDSSYDEVKEEKELGEVKENENIVKLKNVSVQLKSKISEYYKKRMEEITLKKIIRFPPLLANKNRAYEKSIGNNGINCPTCNARFNSETAFNDHYLLVHHNRKRRGKFSRGNIYKCFRCDEYFNNGTELDIHMGTCDAELTDDKIPTNKYGKYNCPSCDKRYVTANFLGEHFIIAHSDYSELSKLDKKENKGYPNKEILKKIKMIEELTPKEINDIINKKEYCEICMYMYKYCNKKIKPIDNKIEETLSDSELCVNNKNTIKRNRSHENIIKMQKQKRNINFKKHIEIYNELAVKNIIPIMLKCCKTLICELCLIEHLQTTNSVKCPFCYKDHENTKISYLIDYVIDKTNDSWSEWWNKHLYIFD